MNRDHLFEEIMTALAGIMGHIPDDDGMIPDDGMQEIEIPVTNIRAARAILAKIEKDKS